MRDCDIFNRTSRLLGQDSMERLSGTRVIIFGIGGVGSWTAEALARTGIGHLTLVDADRVAPSNINRQAEATIDTVGMAKVMAMKQRLLNLNPGISIDIHEQEYNSSTAAIYDFENYDFIVDAIDSLTAKALLINHATASHHPVFFSSMGAALKIDPTKIATAEFWKVQGCPLAAALRRRFRKSGEFPKRKFLCVYSPELHENKGETQPDDQALTYSKVAINGSLCHITAIFGMTIAGLIIKHICDIH